MGNGAGRVFRIQKVSSATRAGSAVLFSDAPLHTHVTALNDSRGLPSVSLRRARSPKLDKRSASEGGEFSKKVQTFHKNEDTPRPPGADCNKFNCADMHLTSPTPPVCVSTSGILDHRGRLVHPDVAALGGQHRREEASSETGRPTSKFDHIACSGQVPGAHRQ